MKTRFTVDINANPRTVLGIRELSSGDLNIHITGGGKAYSAPTIEDLIAVNDETLFEECEKHISIHTSLRSQTDNVIKRTHEYPNRSINNKEIGYHFTTGIKQDNLFVPVLFRIAGDLSRDRYEIAGNSHDSLISLGSYNPKAGQLRFMLVVSSPNTKFPQDIEHPTNLIDKRFSHFRVSVLWSYLNLPSHPHAIDFFLETSNTAGSMRGFHWQEIYNLYTDLNMQHAAEYIKQAGL